MFGSPYIETEHLLLGILREDKLARFCSRSSIVPLSIHNHSEKSHSSTFLSATNADVSCLRPKNRAVEPKAHRTRFRREMLRRRVLRERGLTLARRAETSRVRPGHPPSLEMAAPC